MFEFIKKLFGFKSNNATEEVAPYKIETPVILPPEAEVARPVPVEVKKAVEVKPAVKKQVKKSAPPKKKPAASPNKTGGTRGRKPKAQ